jgi:membrane-associated phospholipid phosphatase
MHGLHRGHEGRKTVHPGHQAMTPCLPSDRPACIAPAPPATAVVAPLPTPIDAIGPDLAEAFGGYNLLFYAGSVAGSAAMAFSGADQSMRVAVQEHLGSSTYGNAASITGYVLPLAVAPGVWLTGLVLGHHRTAGAGSAAIQALGVTAATVAILKIAVGRAYPLNGRSPSAPDRLDHPEDAHTFRPFQSWAWPFPAWPSGHTSSAVSVVAALSAFYGTDELWIPLVGYPIALAIGFGMVVGDDHWTSDLLTGAVLGQCIGWSIGRAFRARARAEAAPAVSLVPIVLPSSQGMGIAGAW